MNCEELIFSLQIEFSILKTQVSHIIKTSAEYFQNVLNVFVYILERESEFVIKFQNC